MDCLESSIVCLEFLYGNFEQHIVFLTVLIAVDFIMLGWFEKKKNLVNKACQSADVSLTGSTADRPNWLVTLSFKTRTCCIPQ